MFWRLLRRWLDRAYSFLYILDCFLDEYGIYRMRLPGGQSCRLRLYFLISPKTRNKIGMFYWVLEKKPNQSAEVQNSELPSQSLHA